MLSKSFMFAMFWLFMNGWLWICSPIILIMINKKETLTLSEAKSYITKVRKAYPYLKKAEVCIVTTEEKP